MIEPVKIGDAELYHADCLEILPTLEGVDCVVADPPYGVELIHKQHKWFKQDGAGYEGKTDTVEEVQLNVMPVISQCILLYGRVIVTPGTRCMFLYPIPTDIGCIFNSSGAGLGSWGFITYHPVLYYGKCPYLAAGKGSRPNGWQQPANDYADKNDHPCPKPIGMMQWLVERGSLEGHTILDPFMGSGTTGVACARLGRKFIGIEIEEKYFQIAVERIDREYAQGKLFQ